MRAGFVTTYDYMCSLIFNEGLRTPEEVAERTGYNLRFVKNYFSHLRNEGWVIEPGKPLMAGDVQLRP